MRFTIDESLTVVQISGGLILVAHLNWLAAFLCMLLAAVVIEEIMPGALTLPAGRDHAGR